MRKLFVILFALAIVPTSFGQTELAGSLSEVYGGYYYIVGDIWIDFGNTATLLPGTTFEFRGSFSFQIWGTLTAEGGSGPDSIRFTTNPVVYPRWRSIRFLGSGSTNSELAYCLIEWSRSLSDQGGGVYCFQSSPTFSNCTVRRDSAYSLGGGIFCNDCSPSFTSCTVSGNNATYAGGGISCYNSTPTFTNCLIMCNRAIEGGGVYCVDSWPTFAGCKVITNQAYGNGGGAYCASYSSPAFANCTIDSNTAAMYGGGMSSLYYASPTFTNCTLNSNIAFDGGGGVHCANSSPTLTNCIIDSNMAYEDGGGAYCEMDASPVFTHCTLSGNGAGSGVGDGAFIATSAPTFNSTIVSFSDGTGICFSNSEGSQIIYCDIFGHNGGNIINPSAGPPGIGQLTTTNANGDSCDTYLNIFLDPLFVGSPTGDIHLTNYSPCIGAANPNLPPPPEPVLFDFEGDPRPNPPASYPDIGADENPLGTPIEPGGPMGRCCFGEPQSPLCVMTTRANCETMSGTWDSTLNCVDNPCPVLRPECPVDSTLFGQYPHLPGENWSFGGSEASEGLRMYENYSVDTTIRDLHFWGVNTNWDPPYGTCNEDPMPFNIGFFPNSAGYPASTPVSTYSVSLYRTGTGLQYPWEMFYYSTDLTPPCTLLSGWVSVQGAGDPTCRFSWASSPIGDGVSYLWAGGTYILDPFDHAVCLTAPPCDTSIRADSVTVRLNAGNTNLVIRFNAPVAGDYTIWSTTNMSAVYPSNFTAEETVTVLVGVYAWTDPGAIVAYKRYLVTHTCPE